MKTILLGALLGVSGLSHAAVEATCVCSKYALAKNDQIVLTAVELYKGGSKLERKACNNSPDPSVRSTNIKGYHFHCQLVKKEDLRSGRNE